MERTECPAVEVPDYVLQIPAPDYPQHWGLVGDNVDHEEKDYLFKSYPEEDLPPLRGNAPWREQGLNMPFPRKRSWDSLNEAVSTEVLSIYFKE